MQQPGLLIPLSDFDATGSKVLRAVSSHEFMGGCHSYRSSGLAIRSVAKPFESGLGRSALNRIKKGSGAYAYSSGA